MYELEIVDILLEALNQEIPARLVKKLNNTQLEFVLKNYFLLTIKPLIYIANIADDDYQTYQENPLYLAVENVAKKENTIVVPVSCAIEQELSLLEQSERHEYLESLGSK